jgi:3,4-dihydroxy 2-butanone 4-phosphate synthase/GTP cyclohydrolase II
VAVFVRDPNPRSVSERISGGHQAYSDNHGQRDYGIGAQILRDLGVEDMILLTSSRRKLTALEGFGLRVVDRRPIAEEAAGGIRLVR